MTDFDYELLPPSSDGLIESLRNIGYTMKTAFASILDNSITAGTFIMAIFTKVA
jgi:hypothetical protein